MVDDAHGRVWIKFGPRGLGPIEFGQIASVQISEMATQEAITRLNVSTPIVSQARGYSTSPSMPQCYIRDLTAASFR